MALHGGVQTRKGGAERDGPMNCCYLMYVGLRICLVTVMGAILRVFTS